MAVQQNDKLALQNCCNRRLGSDPFLFFCQSVPHSPPREFPLTQVRVLHTPFQGGVSHTNPTHKPHRADARGTLWRITGRRGERIVRGRERLFSQPRNRNRWQERLRYSLIDPYSLSLTSSVPRYRHFCWRSQNRISRLPAEIWSGPCIQACYLSPDNRLHRSR